ncbi:MAG: hypothetical protein EOO25_15250 [Comamonadaceae bacterium]|nr:MAG: hypothetical protein EOO25_15250 [Comamonadaceae bacterium]
MQLDIYRRPEAEHKLSFLAVPAGKVLPEEVTNVDWQVEAAGVDLDPDSNGLERFGIEHASGQIAEKGYAITSLSHQVEAED